MSREWHGSHATARVGEHARRWPLFDVGYLRIHAAVVALTWIGLLVGLVLGTGGPGGLGHAFTTTSGWGRNWLIYLAVLAVGYTLVLLGLFRGKRWVVSVGDQGVSLEHHGRGKWHVAWSEIASWQQEVSVRGQLTALLVVGHDGRERRLSFGLFAPTGGLAKDIAAAVAARLPIREGPVQVGQKQPRWAIYVAFGLMALCGIAVLVFLTLAPKG